MRTAHTGGNRCDKEISACARVAGLVDRAPRLANALCGDVMGELNPTDHLRLCGHRCRLDRLLGGGGGASLGKCSKPSSAPARRMTLVGERMEKAWSHISLPIGRSCWPKVSVLYRYLLASRRSNRSSWRVIGMGRPIAAGLVGCWTHVACRGGFAAGSEIIESR
jgi:hypothetical protein